MTINPPKYGITMGADITCHMTDTTIPSVNETDPVTQYGHLLCIL